jgi:hypothetical protein
VILFGSVESVAIPFRLPFHLKNAQAAKRNVFSKMLPVIPLNAAGLEPLIQDFDVRCWGGILLVTILP